VQQGPSSLFEGGHASPSCASLLRCGPPG
jgi:hypothetical protein